MELIRIRKKITGRIVRSGNPVCVSFPKSGRTWVRKMLFDLGLRVPFTHAGASDYESGRTPGFSVVSEFTDNSVLFLIRDPRDVLISYHKDLTLRHKAYDGSLLEMAQTPGIGIDGICDYNRLWIDKAGSFRKFHLARYEDLRADTEAEMARICRFARAYWITAAKIRTVVQASTFEQMKKAERAGAYETQYPKFWFEGAAPDKHPKVRRGKVGGYADEMPPEVLEYCNTRLRALDYPEAYLANPV
jgi:hypothetical protein